MFAGAAVVVPLKAGYVTAASYVPMMNDAWWDALTAVRETTPPDTIVATWWPFGYWAEYVAERRTMVDGGSLPTLAQSTSRRRRSGLASAS